MAPTKPGLKGKKFHFVSAAFKTSRVSICIFLNKIASSLTNAIFKSLWVFSMILAASATLILVALCVPAEMNEPY